MRRPPFTARPLALAVALTVAPITAIAADVAASAVASPQEVNNVVITSADNTISVATEVTGVISGQSALNVNQAQPTDALVLTNNNTYTGGTVVQAGTLKIKRASSLGNGDVELAVNTTLETQSSTTLTQNIDLLGDATISTGGTNALENITQITSSINGAGSLTKEGAGTLSLTADNGYMGDTTIEKGTLAISRAGSLGSGSKVNIADGAVLKTNQDVTIQKDIETTGTGKIDTGGKNSTVEGQITGDILEKTGSGSLTLSNTNNSQTKTIINGGILIVNEEANLGVASDVEITKGTLQTANDMTLSNKIITSGSAGGSINTIGHEVTLTGQITGAGGLVKTGGGTLNLANTSNNFNAGIDKDADGNTVAVGNTVINGGVLSISDDAQLGKQAEDLGVVLTDSSAQYKWKLGNVLIDGGTLKTQVAVETDRYIQIGSAGATIDVNGASNETMLSGLINDAGAGGLVKQGEGTLKVVLNSLNYQNDVDKIASGFEKNNISKVSVNAGVLEVGNAAKDLGGAIPVTLAGGEIRINRESTLGTVSLQNTGGAIDTTGATITTGIISGSGSLQKKGSGTLVLTKDNSYTGNTTISEGKVQIKSQKGLGDANTGSLILDGGSLQVLEVRESDGTLKLIELGKEAIITSNNGTIDNVANDVSLSGTVSGAGQLVKSGVGKFVLANDKNTFEGGVRIKEGTLEVGSDGALGKENTQVLIDGATLAITKDADLKRQIVLTEKGGTVSVAGGSNATLSGELALDATVLSADLTKAGAGTLNLTRDNTQGDFKGNTIIKEGTLGITSQNNLAEGKLFLDGGNLRTNASLNFNKEIIINSTGGVDTALDALGNKTEVTVTGKIQGNGGFVKSGEGTLTLSADNAYAGGTQVKGGTLVVNQDTNLGLASTNISLDSGTLKLTAADSIDFKVSDDADARKLVVGTGGGVLDIAALDVAIETSLSGKGVLTQKGKDSVLTLTANNTTLEGGITVESGTLKIENNTNLGALAAQLTLKDGATLDTTLANTNLILDRSITLGDGTATLKQDENVNIERQLIGTNKANLIVNTGNKTLTLNGDNSNFAGNLQVTGNIAVKQNLGTGILEFNKGQDTAIATDSSLHIAGNATFNNQLKLNGKTSLNADKDTKSVFNAAIKDADYIEKDLADNDVTKFRTGSLVKTGQGEIVLTTKNTYTGGTTVEQGTVTVANNEAFGTGDVVLKGSTTLKSAADISLANKITLDSGIVFLQTPSDIQQTTSLTLSNTIDGDAAIVKRGAGTLSLTGENTYRGITLVEEGRVVINNAQSLGDNANVYLNSNTALETTQALVLNKKITLQGDDGTQATIKTANGDMTLSGTLNNTGAKVGLIKEGLSTLELQGDNSSYEGKTTIKEGALAIHEANNLGGKIAVELAGGSLKLLESLTIGASQDDAISITGSRGAIDTLIGTESNLAIAFKGTGLFVKEGEGKLTLSGDNTNFKGGVSIDDGILAITKDNSLGEVDTTLTLNGGTLQTDGVTSLSRDVQLNQDSTISNIDALTTVALNRLKGNHEITLNGNSFNLSGDATHSNDHLGTKLQSAIVTISKDADLGQLAGDLSFVGDSTLKLQGQLDSERNVNLSGINNTLDVNQYQATLGVLSGTGDLAKTGTGDLVLKQNSQNYSGNTDIEQGQVIVSDNQALGTGSVLLDDNTAIQTAADIILANQIIASGDVTLDTMANNSALTGVVSGSANLDKVGSGSLALNGVNSFVGELDVQAGSVAINNAHSLGANSNSVLLANGTALETAAAVTAQQAIQVSGDVSVNTAGHDSTLAGMVSGAGNITKMGTGTLNLQGVNTFVGNLSVSGGTLGVSTDANLGATSNKVMLNQATLMANLASVVLNHEIDITNTATIDSSTNALTLNKQITGGALVKTGTGSLLLAANNSYQGGTTVNAGTLKVSQNANLGDLAAKVVLNGGIFESTGTQSYARDFSLGTSNGTFNVLTDTTVTLTQLVDGAGKLNKTGTGTLVLTGNNTYQGGTAINAGTLVVSQAANLGTGTSLSISNASLQATANLTLQNVALTGTANVLTDNTVTVDGVVSGSGALVKQGLGNLVLNGQADNTYSGGTVLESGTLTLANGSSLGLGALTVKAGQVALKDGFVSTSNFIQNSANSDSMLLGNGTFANVNVSAGQLTIDGNIIATNASQVDGVLLVNGKLTGPITVGSSGKLGGSGTLVGLLNVNGILAPGNSPAILTVTGDVNQNVGSTLEIELDGATAGTGAGYHDQLNILGTYNIAATNTTLEAKLRGITGDATNTFVPTLGQSFDVVKANSVVGTFAKYQVLEGTKDGLVAGTRLDIGYTPNSVRLYVTPQSYLTVAGVDNATGAAKFLDEVLQVRDTNPAALIGTSDLAKLYNALLPATTQQLNAAMVSMSPAIYAETAQSFLALQQTLHNTQTLLDVFSKGGIALKGLSQETDVDSDGNGLAATRTMSGVQLSLDSEPYDNNWQMGATLSVVNKADIESQNANITAKGQDVSVSIRKKVNNWMLGAALDMGSYEFDSKRNVVVANTVFATNQQGISAETQGLALNASYDMGSWLINGGVRYNAVQQDGFTEAGNSLLNLTVAGVDENQVVAMLGGAWSQTWKKSMWDIAPKFGLQLEQTLMGDTAQLNAKLGSQVVNASAADAGKTLLRATAGINFINVDGLSVGFDASVEEGDGLSSKTGRVLFSKSF